MSNRTPQDQSLVDFMLRSIKSKTTDEIIAMHQSGLKVTLSEMIVAGLQARQLNTIPLDFVKEIFTKKEITRDELEGAGMEEDNLNQIDPIIVLPPPSPFPPDPSPFPPIGTGQGPSPVPAPGGSNMINRIRERTATAIDVRDALINNEISDADLTNNFGYSSEMINMIRNFVPQVTYFPPLTELPPLRTGATDIYFLGMPASGKSTMLASFLYYGNRSGLLRRDTNNTHGNKYANQLIMGMAQGYLPSSTPTELINYIPLSLRNPDNADSSREMNLVDMAGEKFRKVGNDGMQEFKAIRDYLTNENSKCLIFVMDYFKEDQSVALMEQDQNLQEVIAQLDKAGIMARTETIYMVVTKADLFPTDDKKGYAKEYIERNYRNFLSYCQEVKKKHKLTLKSFPYSIGPSELTYLMKDKNPSTNVNLENYPKLLTNQILEDFPFTKKGFGLW
jgi:hypothetical protein